MLRRMNNTGSIVQRNNGTWQGSIQINGVRRTAYGKTKGEVSNKIDDLRSDASKNGGLPTPGNRTINQLFESWLDTCAGEFRPRTLEHYKAVFPNHISPTLGNTRLSRIQSHHIQSLYVDLERRNLKRIPSQVHAMLHRMFKLAVLWRWIGENPCDRVIRPIHRASTKEVWNQLQTDTFIEAVKDHWLGPLWITLLGTGCRLGEATGLHWSDIDGETIHIRRNLQRINGEWIEGTPKTESGKRSLSLPTLVVDALRRQSAQQAEWKLAKGAEWLDRGLLFTNRHGDPIHRAVVSHTIAKVCKRLSLPPLSPHGLRHLSASMLIAQGIPLPAVSKRLGHSKVSITLDVYSHVVGGEDQAAADVMDKVMGGAG
jgi:integrase